MVEDEDEDEDGREEAVGVALVEDAAEAEGVDVDDEPPNAPVDGRGRGRAVGSDGYRNQACSSRRDAKVAAESCHLSDVVERYGRPVQISGCQRITRCVALQTSTIEQITRARIDRQQRILSPVAAREWTSAARRIREPPAMSTGPINTRRRAMPTCRSADTTSPD